MTCLLGRPPLGMPPSTIAVWLPTGPLVLAHSLGASATSPRPSVTEIGVSDAGAKRPAFPLTRWPCYSWFLAPVGARPAIAIAATASHPCVSRWGGTPFFLDQCSGRGGILGHMGVQMPRVSTRHFSCQRPRCHSHLACVIGAVVRATTL